MIFEHLVEALVSVKKDDLIDAVDIAKAAKRKCRRFIFIGNGGSSAIASHMAADWLKNGKVAAMCFNDVALMSCISNDIGYQDVFAEPMWQHGEQDAVLFAISSSGQSESILRAVAVAQHNKYMKVVTLSGFAPDNPLRSKGDVNFYVPSDRYGIVEVAHHAICHSILDAVLES